MNPDALSIEPLCSFNWIPTHFEMSLGLYFQKPKKKKKHINLKISLAVQGQQLIFNLGIPLTALRQTGITALHIDELLLS